MSDSDEPQAKNVTIPKQPGYSKLKLLEWVNEKFDGYELVNLEQISTGEAICVIMNQIFPGSIPSGSINVGEIMEDRLRLANWKLFQHACTQLKVDRQLDVKDLVIGKPRDVLDFMQWFKLFYDANKEAKEPELI